MGLIATANDPEANSYLTVEEASEIMNGFLTADKWDELRPESSEQTGQTIRERLLRTAARLVDRYRPLPPKQVPTQALAWPTTKEAAGEIPRAVKLAVCEWIDGYLQGADFMALKRLQAEGVTTLSKLGQSSTFEKDMSMLPGGARRELDRLIDTYDTIVVEGPAQCEPPIWE